MLAAAKLFLHAVYWIAGPIMMLIAVPAFLWPVDAFLALGVWLLLTVLFAYTLNRQACRHLRDIGIDVPCPRSVPAAVIAYGMHCVHGCEIDRGVQHHRAQVQDREARLILDWIGLNMIERGLVSIIDTSTAHVHPYLGMSSSISYSLIRAANRTDLNDYYLEQSLVNYYLDCGIPALGHGSSNRRQRLLHDTDNLMTEFGEWQNVALFTTYHLADSDAGELRSCTDAWTATDGLRARLSDAGTFDGLVGRGRAIWKPAKGALVAQEGRQGLREF